MKLRFDTFLLPILTLALGTITASVARAQPVQGDVVAVGFQAAVDEKWVTREGRWTPVLLQVQAQGSEHFQGELRIDRVDLDGDIVSYTDRPVALTGNEGVKRVWCYVAPTREDQRTPVMVDVIADGGAQITSIKAPEFGFISDDVQLILDISARPLTAIRNLLDSGSNSYNDSRSPDEHGYYRKICVATLPFRDLPDRWIGLESANVIVWDEPDVDKVSPAQLDALVTWVRNGGQLVLGIGAAWTSLSKSPLSALLPVTGDEPPIEVATLPQFLNTFATDKEGAFKTPVSFALGKPRDAAVVLKYDLVENNRAVPLLTLGYFGSGRVIVCATRLRDLFEAAPRPAFFSLVFDVNQLTKGFLDSLSKAGLAASLNHQALYAHVTAPIDFRSSAGQFVLIVGAFVLAYIVLSTGGAWYWLRRGARTNLSWPVFAGFAVIGSFLSLGAVSLSRGVSSRLHSMTVYDLEAGKPDARALGLFGYRSPIRQDVDFSLNGTTAFLRPLSPTPDAMNHTQYSTPMRYAALPDKSRLENTKLRATLKQFEGQWESVLEGALNGQIAVSRSTGQITPDSWIKSDLDATMALGYLLFIDPRLSDETGAVPARASGLTTSVRAGKKYLGYDQIPPAANVLAVELSSFKPSEKVTALGAKHYADVSNRHATWALPVEPKAIEEPQLGTLWSLQTADWAPSLREVLPRISKDCAALALASTRGLYLSNPPGNDFSASGGIAISTDGLMNLDVTHWLTRGQAVLLLFSDQPGPATLQAGGTAKSAATGVCFYRVRIPISYVP